MIYLDMDQVKNSSTPRLYNTRGTFSVPDKPSQWSFDGKKLNLTAPSLTIESYEIPVGGSITAESDRYFYSIDGRQSELYNGTYMLNHGSCKPSETYQWGFSYIFLFMVSIFNFIWSCIMVGMWYDTRRGSRMYKHGRRPGLLRSVMEFSAAIREELGAGAQDMEEEELRRNLTGSGGALVVPKEELRITRTDTGEKVKKRSWKRSLTRGSTF